jgi:hypothetical protein
MTKVGANVSRRDARFDCLFLETARVRYLFQE